MGEQFQDIVKKITVDADKIAAVVLTGEGRAFSAGGDLAFLEQRHYDSPSRNSAIMRNFYQRFLSLRSLPVPIIAAINGPAIGAGLCVALGCDLRIAASDAKLGVTFVGLGLHPVWCTMQAGAFQLSHLAGHGLDPFFAAADRPAGSQQNAAHRYVAVTIYPIQLQSYSCDLSLCYPTEPQVRSLMAPRRTNLVLLRRQWTPTTLCPALPPLQLKWPHRGPLQCEHVCEVSECTRIPVWTPPCGGRLTLKRSAMLPRYVVHCKIGQ